MTIVARVSRRVMLVHSMSCLAAIAVGGGIMLRVGGAPAFAIGGWFVLGGSLGLSSSFLEWHRNGRGLAIATDGVYWWRNYSPHIAPWVVPWSEIQGVGVTQFKTEYGGWQTGLILALSQSSRNPSPTKRFTLKEPVLPHESNTVLIFGIHWGVWDPKDVKRQIEDRLELPLCTHEE